MEMQGFLFCAMPMGGTLLATADVPTATVRMLAMQGITAGLETKQVAVVRMYGALDIDYAEWKVAQIEGHLAENGVAGVVLLINSVGGEMTAMQTIAETLKGRTKPVVAVVEGACQSAAYFVAAHCDHIVATSRMAVVGSLGTMVRVVDSSKAMSQQGVKIVEKYAPQSVRKNEIGRAMAAGDDSLLMARLAKVTSYFLEDIYAQRGDKIKATAAENPYEGADYLAEDALALGLIDEIGVMQGAVAMIEEMAANDSVNDFLNQNKDTKMAFGLIHAPKLSAIRNVEATDLTAEQHEEALEEMEALGLGGLVQALIASAAPVATATEPTQPVAEAGLLERMAALETRLAGYEQPGATPTAPVKTEAEVVETVASGMEQFMSEADVAFGKLHGMK